ncbi:uncharacterized protein LOC119791901 [Cyprinodon tularosa]|uniref:uncharacterized protein LOC119791901 n=1 Tax=Cyprinodon tularosa TaxID=77115 RepID=UPI0018E205C3|nr:uncharacterized protein LOC119791901 [Cyprinodon tularosa]
MMSEDQASGDSATAATITSSDPPSWVKILLEQQAHMQRTQMQQMQQMQQTQMQQMQHMQQTLAGLTTHLHSNRGPSPQLTAPAVGVSTVNSDQVTRSRTSHATQDGFARPSLQEHSISHSPVVSQATLMSAPRAADGVTNQFAAELDVIQQRSQSTGPPWLLSDSGAVDRARGMERERGRQRFTAATSRTHGSSHIQSDVPPTAPYDGPRPKMATYDGKEDWEPFLLPFERLARKYSWTGAERVDKLHECLRGAAMRYVCSLPEHIREDYTLLKEHLTQRFGHQDPPTTVRRKLGELRQSKESSAEFAEEVRRLVTFAYPGVDMSLQDQLAADAFLKGLKDQKLAYEVMNKDPCTLADAQKLVEAHEHNYKATVGREVDLKGRTRRVSWADDNDEMAHVSRRVQTPTYVTADQFKGLLEKVEQMQLTLSRLQPVMSEQRGQRHSDVSPGREHGVYHDQSRRQQQPTQSRSSARTTSASPPRSTKGPCYGCGEAGHFRRECSRSPSPTTRRTTASEHDMAQEQTRSPTLTISRATNRGPSLHITLKVNNTPVQAVVDTGAEATVLSEGLYKQLYGRDPPHLKKAVLHNAESNSEMTAMSGVQVVFQIGTHSFDWDVYVAPIHDCLLLGLDFLRAANVTIEATGRVFIAGEPIPAKIVGGEGPDYSVARVLLERDTTLPPECECVVWGEVEYPRPGVPAVLEPTSITENVSSGSAVTNMDARVPVRLCNLSSDKAALRKGACLGILIEAFSDDSTLQSELDIECNSDNDPKSAPKIGRVVTAKATDLPEHVQTLYTASGETLSEEQQEKLIVLLLNYQSLFAVSDTDLGYFSAVSHQIDTGTARPVRQPARRTPLGFQNEEETHLQSMLNAGVITPSSSGWASPVVLVRKKDGGVRWCVDYRHLNSLTTKDAYPLPKIEECLDVLGGATVFSTLDLQSGYWQIAVDERDRGKTAFITKYGLYEYTRMPFGLCNAPGTFQRAMEFALRGLQWDTLLIYLDDIIILGKDVEESLDRLTEVFGRLQSFGLKLKPSKCQLLKEEVLFLGHVVSGEGIRPNSALVKDVQDWPYPTGRQELQAFLGLCNYYRKFVPSFAELASPLTYLLKKEVQFEWGEEQREAFLHLKEKLTSSPILAYPTSEGKFILDTDASNHSIGAVLSQNQWGEERVISYASNHLTSIQQRYCVTRRELLAVIKFTRQFRHYLLGRRFLLRTDHNSLVWLFRFKNPQGQLARWLEEMSQYDFEIEHREGRRHLNADGMSRKDGDGSESCDCYEAGQDVASLPCHGCAHCQRLDQQWAKFTEDVDDVVPLAVRRLTTNEDEGNRTKEQPKDPVTEGTGTPATNWLQPVTQEEWALEQRKDPVLSKLHQWIEKGELPTRDEVSLESPAARKYWLCWPQIELHHGVLVYRWERADGGQPRHLLLVPTSMQMELIRACHDPPHGGHLGIDKTLQRLKQSYHWYAMGGDVQLFVQKCQNCTTRKTAGPTTKAALQSYQTGAPLDRLQLDILGPFPVSTAGNKYILVIIDQFTRWVEAYGVPDQGAETTARRLVYDFISRFGCPLELHSDQGRNFESTLFKTVCQLLQITKTRTTPYHPASNGQVERFNRTLLQMVRCYVDQNQKNWDEHLPLLTAAYRSTKNASTGCSPNRLMLGREVHQPHDIWSGAAEFRRDRCAVPEFLSELEQGLKEAQETAREHLKAAQERQKRTYDVRAKGKPYAVGDLVFVKDSTKRKGFSPKLQPPWKGPSIIASCLGPVLYEVIGKRDRKILHHDRLKPYTSDVIPGWT